VGKRHLALAVALVLIVLGSIAVAQYSVSRFYYLALDYYEVKASNTAYGAFVGYGALGYLDLIAFRLDNNYYLINTTANTYYSRTIEFEGGYRDTGVWYCGSKWGLWAIGNNVYWERIIRFYDSTLANMLYEGYATYAGAFYGLGVDYLVLGSASFGASVFDMEVYSLSCAGDSLSVSRGTPVAVPPSGYSTGGRPIVVGSFKDYVLMVAPVQSDTKRAVAYGVGALDAGYFYLNVVLEFDLSTYFVILMGYETAFTFEFAVVTSSTLYWVTVYKDTRTFTYTAYPGSYGTFTESDLTNPGTLVPDSLGNPMYALYGNPLRVYHFDTGYFMTVGFNTPGSVIATYKRDIVLPVRGIMRSLYSYGYLKLKVAELTTTVVSPITVYNTVTTTATQTTTTTQTVTETATATTTVTTTQTATQTVTNTVTTTQTVTETTTIAGATTTVTEVIVLPQVRTETKTVTTTKFVGIGVGLDPTTVALLALVVLFVVLVALLVKKR
jgi:hypothetical protein